MLFRKILAVFAIAAIPVASGCGSANAPHPNATATTAGSTSAVAVQQAPLACQDVHLDYDVELKDQHIRCALNINPGSSIEVSSDPAWSFILRGNGTTTQEFHELTDKIGETGVTPLLADIDNSGIPVLLVVLDRGGTGGERQR